MSFEILLVILLLIITIILFATERLPVDLVAMIVMATLLLIGIVTPEDGISGFSNTATVTVAAMFIISAGLYKTGALNFVGLALARIGKQNFWIALIALMLGVGTISAFINNTAAMAIFLPIALGIARDANISPSKLLMPVSFASMFGGVCTLIGTSTNILVGSIAERYGQPAFTMFEFAPLGLAIAGAGILYMLLIGVRLIPERRSSGDLTQNYGMGDYLTEIVLQPEAKAIGHSIADSPLVREVGVDIIDLYRDGTPVRPLAPWTVLRAGDTLRLRCDVQKVKELQEREGIVLRPDLKLGDKDLKAGDATLVEAVIAPNSIMEGKTLKRVRFRHRFDAIALAIRHRGEVMHDNLESTVLRAGDVLLMEVKKDRLDELKRDRAFVIVSEVGLPEFRKQKIFPALVIVSGIIITATVGLLPIMVAAIIGCVLLVLSGCLTLEEAYDSIDWKVIFLLAGVLTLGIALEKTGAATLISEFLIAAAGPLGPAALVAIFYLLSSLLTAAMSNNATAALLVPIAIVTAESVGIEAKPLLMAVAFAVSLDFMTPFGYQTNTMIYGPGQYKFVDFLRVGTPLNILFWVLATLLIPHFWPF